MMRADQFVVSKRDFPEGWVRCRRDGVTATQVAKAATPAGFETSVRDHLDEYVEMDNPYMKFGRDMEPVVARMLHQEFGVMPNDWLLRHESVGHHLATPDGLSLNHDICSEIKTTGKDFEQVSIPIQYRRQVQWQLHVTGGERCLFAWMLRVEVDGMYAPAWWAPKHVWIERDEEMIETLIGVADELWERVKHG